MGGIAGWVAVPRRAREDAALGDMLSAIAHRFLGQTELHAVAQHSGREQAVLGATLHEGASGISIALDGAIANAAELRAFLGKRGHAFADGGDAEVLLRAYQHWDKEVVKQLRGAFALALWDARKERLLLARDRFGANPLYLHEKDGVLHFASEPKALLAAPGIVARADTEALLECVVRGYVAGSRTLFEGIRKLPPACYALWQLGRLHESRYWTAPDSDPAPTPRSAFGHNSDGEAVEAFLATLEETVKGESGAGLLLSGGLDSVVLGALLAKQGAAIKTFSLGFEGEKGSELPLAAQAAKHFGAEHHEVVSAPRELAALLAALVRQRDAPLTRASDLAVHALATEAARSVPRALTGEGCDEVLGGYRRYVVRSLNPAEGPLRQALYEDQTGPLPDDLLERADRIGASAGVELRMPYLDHRLAERVSAEPDAIRVRGLSTKWILRRAAERLLPAAVRKGPKRGFRPPLAEWLRGPLREPLEAPLPGRG